MKYDFLAGVILAVLAGTAPGAEADLGSLPVADVYFLGEVHDNPLHHTNQAQAVAGLKPAALVFEMLTDAQAQAVTPSLRSDARALENALGWATSGWPDFSMYYPIFVASGAAQIYGAGVPREAVRAAMSEGVSEVTLEGEARKYGLLDDLQGAMQEAREAKQMAAHCDALPEDMLAGMVMAQRLRDAKLAQVAVQAFEETGGPVAVIVGNGHARIDWGAPSLIPQGISVYSIGQLERPRDAPQPYDMWITTAATPRSDPCEAFK